MKKSLLLIFIGLSAGHCFGQQSPKKRLIPGGPNVNYFTAFEDEPLFPGGKAAFFRFVQSEVEMPDVVKLLSFAPKVAVSIYLNRDGKVVGGTPATNSGTGLEDSIITCLLKSPKWRPGRTGDGVYRHSKITVPFSIKPISGIVVINKLRQSDFGFVFNIKDKLYRIDDAEKILGSEFSSQLIENVLVYADDNYIKADKAKSFLIIIRSE